MEKKEVILIQNRVHYSLCDSNFLNLLNNSTGLPTLSCNYFLACHAFCRHFPMLPNFYSCLPFTFGETLLSATILFD
jgi:hypothetical protein